jgi:4-amino-4-deoxy-L-arabinose transferase-like glycosyltransferase
MTAPQWVSAAAGTLIAGVGAVAFVRDRTLRLRALISLIVGAFLIYAAFRPAIIEWMGPDSDLLRLRWMIGLLSLAVLTATLEAIRVSRMQERYALLWLATGTGLLAGSLFPELAAAVTRLTGMSFGAIVGVALLAFVLFLLFHLCLVLSDLRERLACVTRDLARVEEKVRRLSDAPSETGKEPPDRTTPPYDGPSSPT